MFLHKLHMIGSRAFAKQKRSKRGFTLIEVLIVIGILAILATLVLVAVNPSKQFKSARDTKRTADVATILSAISQNMTDHSGIFVCDGSQYVLPTTNNLIMSDDDQADIAHCLVPEYIAALPLDPSASDAHWTNDTDYKTGYFVRRNADGRVVVSATPEGSGLDAISVTQ